MNYDIKLFAHGVPNGQCSWGVGSLDSNYIDAFYGRKSSVSAQMFAEIRQFGSSVYSYYTYYVGNTNDYIRRPGGFFALTVRINYYYADVKNIYNLLDAAFNKFIVGSVVKAASGVFKYIIPDFSQVDANLKALEQEIKNYLMQFSSDSDFASLSGFNVNGQNEAATLNLLECDAEVVANHVKTHSSISISPYHPSFREKQIINDMTAKINAVTNQAQQQIKAAQHDKEVGIQAIRNEYKDADKTVSGLREEIKKVNNDNIRLNGEVTKLSLKVQNCEAYKNKFENSQEQLEKANAVLEKVRDNLPGLMSVIAEILGMPSNSSHGRTHEGSKQKEKKDGFSFMKIIRGIHPFTDFFVMIILLCIVGFTLPKSCEGSSTELLAANERIEQLEKQLEEIQNASTGVAINTEGIDVDGGIVADHQPTLAERFPKARIDVAGISANKPMRYRSADTYTVSLKNVDGNLGGVWKSSDFDIHNGNLAPKHTGACTISYVVNGVVFVTRTIYVAE